MVIGDRSGLSLSQLEVLVVDCQATAAAPGGHLLEIGWARVRTTIAHTHARLIALPDGGHIPSAVSRITGITEHLARGGVAPRLAWGELSDEAARLTPQPAPTVIHFARFEQPYLRAFANDVFPLDIVCTHDIARRLLPDLPRRSLRALTGYFGRAVGALRRSGDHVEATAFIWRELVRLLEAEGVSTWSALHEWLGAPVHSIKRSRRIWPMPRDVRLAVPDAPGVYRMLRTSGDVLYVGKASSLRHRVNSYFRKQNGVSERMLEMLSQARGISFEVAPSTLEAALVEPDEIKRHRPPYNVALTVQNRALWFASPDLSARSAHRSTECPLGPFPSAETLNQFRALAHADRTALAQGRWGPDEDTFKAGYTRLCAAHRELSRSDLGACVRLLRLGTRLWSEGRRDRDTEEEEVTGFGRDVTVWTPEDVQLASERLALRAAHARRRARWLTRLVDAAVVWSEPGMTGARLIVVENGEIILNDAVDTAMPPIPPGYRRPIAARREVFTIACFDRLRVLTSELKRLTAAGAPVAVRFGTAPGLIGARLAAALWWL